MKGSIVLVLFAFLLYYGIVSEKIMSRISPGSPARIFLNRLAGVLCFGLLPLFILFLTGETDLSAFGWKISSWKTTGIFLVVGFPVMVFVGFLGIRLGNQTEAYPQIRQNEWTVLFFLLNGLSWAAYLLCYEFLFRGILLFSLYRTYGYLTGILLNVFLYSLVHLPKGKAETLGAIPFGTFVCVISLYTGNIWSSVFFHFCMAVSHEYFAIRVHPEMSIVKKRTA